MEEQAACRKESGLYGLTGAFRKSPTALGQPAVQGSGCREKVGLSPRPQEEGSGPHSSLRRLPNKDRPRCRRRWPPPVDQRVFRPAPDRPPRGRQSTPESFRRAAQPQALRPCRGRAIAEEKPEPMKTVFQEAGSRASRTRGGDNGRSEKRTPVAARTALATAGIGGTMGASPTPRTP